MPSVATAPTADNAKTRAATTRLLGFYEGVGGAKVDALFSPDHFVTRDAAGNVSLNGAAARTPAHVSGAARAPSLTEASAAVEIQMDVTTVLGLGGGTGAMGYALWLQGLQYNAGYSGTAFPLALNPVGGSVLVGGSFLPVSDNAINLGSGPERFAGLYLGSNPIVTSDQREKTWRGAASTAELAAARRIIAELGFYQWNEAIAEKGADGARLHFGVRAQAVWAIMADEGLIYPLVEGVAPDSRYAFLCYDETPAVEAAEEVRDEEGNIVTMAREARPAGNRFGVRTDQLALFLIAAQEARIAALEAAA